MLTLHFTIDYYSRPDERLEVYILTDNAQPQILPLTTTDGHSWHGAYTTAAHPATVRHAYRVTRITGPGANREERLNPHPYGPEDDTACVRCEHNSWRLCHLAPDSEYELWFADAWADHALPPYAHHTALHDCTLARQVAPSPHAPDATLTIGCCTFPAPEGRYWALVGETPSLGGWDVNRARRLTAAAPYRYGLALDAAETRQLISELPCEGDSSYNIRRLHYKYVLLREGAPADSPLWETGANRTLCLPSADETLSSGGLRICRTDDMPQCAALPTPRWAGLVVPVFSLRSEGSAGIGDFGDLRLLIDWAARLGLHAIQLLPLCDTTRTGSWRDSYPYSAISVFALHPAYLDLRPFADTKAYKAVREEAAALNALAEVDYEGAAALKQRFLHLLFEEKGAGVEATSGYQRFVTDNCDWLPRYAAYCALRDSRGLAYLHDHAPEESEGEADERDCRFWQFVQYLLHCQLLSAREAARAARIILKGDLPIGVSRDSVDAWTHPALFHLDGTAGAPPDAFARDGQNWGFPTYDWAAMRRDGYRWWRRRLSHMGRYFDAYRIDHVLGFFRIWEVPADQIDGLLGRFRPALPLSAEEMRAAGFKADASLLALPYVSREKADELTARYGREVIARCLMPLADHFTLRPPYRSQRAIRTAFGESAPALATELHQLATQCLFIADPDKPECYHPRIEGQRTAAYAALTDPDRIAFDRLYDDFYYHRHNDFWAAEAMAKLPAITHSHDSHAPVPQLCPLPETEGGGMLPCAEDLGMIPACVPDVLRRLDILTLEVSRMPKAYGVAIGDPAANPPLSVDTIDTHDMPPLRLWWMKNPQLAATCMHDLLHEPGDVPSDPPAALCRKIIGRHLASPSMLCLLSLQDWLSLSPTLRYDHPEREQINDPANSEQYWRYRIHLPIERLMADEEFTRTVRQMVAASGR